MSARKKENNWLRAAAAAVLLAALIALVVIGGRTLPDSELRYGHCLAEPDRYDGEHISMNSTPLLFVGDGFFTVVDEGREMKIYGAPGRTQAGGRVSIEAVFHSDGSLTLVNGYFHSMRPLKIAVSLAALVFFVFYWFRRYRFEWKGMYFIEKS